MSRCPGCGADFPDREGPTHRYMESSPACWAAFGEVMAREYSDPTYFPVHRLSVDAYAVQHPGRPSPQTIQSVNLHLIRLCSLLELSQPMEKANDIMLAATGQKERYVWLTPPASLGEVTVKEVYGTKSVEEHLAAVRRWSDSAWRAWAPHHETVRGLIPKTY